MKAQALVDTMLGPYKAGWGYIWGTSGQVWTQAKQNAATRDMTVKYGQKWVGKTVSDCSGLFVWGFKQFGESIYHGSNTIWNKYCSKQGKLKNGQRTDGIALRPGTAVFLYNGTKRHHIGLYVGDDMCVEAKGTINGVVMSKSDHWDEWGELAAVDYSDIPEEPIPVQHPTLRRGDRGEEVRQLQQQLNDAGYNCGKVDGIFGSGTESSVKALQADNGLKADGICGLKTWAVLGAIEDQGQEPMPDEDEQEDPVEDEETQDDGIDDAMVVSREDILHLIDVLDELHEFAESLLQ